MPVAQKAPMRKSGVEQKGPMRTPCGSFEQSNTYSGFIASLNMYPNIVHIGPMDTMHEIAEAILDTMVESRLLPETVRKSPVEDKYDIIELMKQNGDTMDNIDIYEHSPLSETFEFIEYEEDEETEGTTEGVPFHYTAFVSGDPNMYDGVACVGTYTTVEDAVRALYTDLFLYDHTPETFNEVVTSVSYDDLLIKVQSKDVYVSIKKHIPFTTPIQYTVPSIQEIVDENVDAPTSFFTHSDE